MASGWYSDWRDGDCAGEQVYFAPTRFTTWSGMAGALSSIRFSSAAQCLRKSVELAKLESFIRSNINYAWICRCNSLYFELYSACKIPRASRSSSLLIVMIIVAPNLVDPKTIWDRFTTTS